MLLLLHVLGDQTWPLSLHQATDICPKSHI